MCHSFTITGYQGLERALGELAGQPVPAGAVPTHIHEGAIAYPGTFAPVIVAGHGDEGNAHHSDRGPQGEFGTGPQTELFPLEVRELGFGWPVEWKQGTVFNARFETLLRGGGMWGDVLAERRCILPCESFFESHRSEMGVSARSGKPVKRRYEFRMADSAPLLLGAVYDGESFSVVTTEPNGDVSPIHDRMPLVLTIDEARVWLDGATPLSKLAELADRRDIHLEASTDEPAIDEDPLQPELPF